MATAPLPMRRTLRCQATVTVLILFFFPALRIATPQTPANLPKLISKEDAVRIALAYNQSLRAQRLNVDQSKAEEITALLKPNPTLTWLIDTIPIFSPQHHPIQYADLLRVASATRWSVAVSG